MRCDEYEVLISAYADGELDGPQKADLQAHINVCQDCKRLYEDTLRLQGDMADALLKCPAVPDLVSAVKARLQPKPRLRFNWAWAAAATAGLVAVCSYAVMHPTPSPEPAPKVPIVRQQPTIAQQHPKPVVRLQKPEQLAENKPKERAPQPKLKPLAKHVDKPANRPAPRLEQMANTGSETPDVSADAAEVVVEYIDGTYAAGYTADLYASPAPQVPVAGVGRQVVADTEIVTENGIPTQRICYRIVDNEHPKTLNEPTQGEPNEIN